MAQVAGNPLVLRAAIKQSFHAFLKPPRPLVSVREQRVASHDQLQVISRARCYSATMHGANNLTLPIFETKVSDRFFSSPPTSAL